ncbi:hypothetical protein FACS1894130_12860 [Spirochaetia bacterium]|nr:hypothetical protein FACS1894130_12860 [Spirochaetia bacterium]
MYLDKKVLFLFCSIIFIGNIYPAGVRFAEKYDSNSGIDKYLNGNIKSININNRFMVASKWNERVIDGTLTHLSNGLFIYENTNGTRKYLAQKREYLFWCFKAKCLPGTFVE